MTDEETILTGILSDKREGLSYVTTNAHISKTLCDRLKLVSLLF